MDFHGQISLSGLERSALDKQKQTHNLNMWMSTSFWFEAAALGPGSPAETRASAERAVHVQHAQHLRAATGVPPTPAIVRRRSDPPPACLCAMSHAETRDPDASALAFHAHRERLLPPRLGKAFQTA